MRPILALLVLLVAACAPRQQTPHAGTSAPGPLPASPANGLAHDDRIRLAETFRLAGEIGDAIWSGWTSAPFAVLLVTSDRELLVRHPRPSPDFTRVGYDSLLGGDVYARPRTMSPSFLATFPAVGGVPTIVVGRPAATRRTSTTWVLTLLHEHFHQLQMSRPGYYARVNALGLARGDQSGMWMLDFPFPYDSGGIAGRFGELTRNLDSALAATSGAERASRWRAVVDARERLRAALAPDDEKYLAFQMWQEGVARYTELQAARWASDHYAPTAAFRALADFTSFAAAATKLESDIRAELQASDLARSRRVVFYPAGAATALLLDAAAPGWRTRYLDGEFSLDALAR